MPCPIRETSVTCGVTSLVLCPVSLEKATEKLVKPLLLHSLRTSSTRAVSSRANSKERLLPLKRPSMLFKQVRCAAYSPSNRERVGTGMTPTAATY